MSLQLLQHLGCLELSESRNNGVNLQDFPTGNFFRQEDGLGLLFSSWDDMLSKVVSCTCCIGSDFWDTGESADSLFLFLFPHCKSALYFVLFWSLSPRSCQTLSLCCINSGILCFKWLKKISFFESEISQRRGHLAHNLAAAAASRTIAENCFWDGVGFPRLGFLASMASIWRAPASLDCLAMGLGSVSASKPAGGSAEAAASERLVFRSDSEIKRIDKTFVAKTGSSVQQRLYIPIKMKIDEPSYWKIEVFSTVKSLI